MDGYYFRVAHEFRGEPTAAQSMVYKLAWYLENLSGLLADDPRIKAAGIAPDLENAYDALNQAKVFLNSSDPSGAEAQKLREENEALREQLAKIKGVVNA